MTETMTLKRRVRVDHDPWGSMPDFDAHVPVLRATYHNRWGEAQLDLEPVIGKDYLEHVKSYLEADYNDVFDDAELYLRTLGPTRRINTQDNTYFLVATPAWLEMVGCEDLELIRSEVEGGEPTEFEHWLEGEVYQLVLEESHPMKDLVTGEVFEEWMEIDWISGFYGWECAHSLEAARDAFGLGENEHVEIIEGEY
jgi:hypothetical protein